MTSTTPGSEYPPPAFRFAVRFHDDRPAYFREFSGLDGEAAGPTEYRSHHGDRPPKVPNLPRFGNVTLHRGIVGSDSKLLKWCEQARTVPVERSTLTVQLLNESGAITTVWTLRNAWPTKLVVTDGTENERAIEAMELSFESITVSQ
ncbi:MAG TPA: phage tail protein [Thermoanaerobaculia bacterium]|jgi:phage tail-like protein|nr:phage tail protein [Thermoanaerobaculia bacterium]